MCHVTWAAGHRMINIFPSDRGWRDHFRDFPILPVGGPEFVEIENKLGVLPGHVNLSYMKVFFELAPGNSQSRDFLGD
jgi:hypothetical protein